MSNLFSSRKGPLMIATGIFGGLLYMTYGGRQQPRPRATHDARSQSQVSETLQSIAGTGGESARSGADMDSLRQHDPKDTRMYTADPSAYSKRNPDAVRSDLVGGHGTTAAAPGQGKNIGERDPEKSGDLPWKKIGS